MGPRRTAFCAAGLLLASAVSLGAQTTPGPPSAKRVECSGPGPSGTGHDFRRVTSDSEEVRVLPGAPPELGERLTGTPRQRRIPRDRQDYDLVLDIPRLCIEHLELRVDSLRARVSIDANIAGMVSINAGAGVAIDHVDLTLENVHATLLLAVDLSRLVQVVNETMSFLEANPDVLKRVLGDSLRRRP